MVWKNISQVSPPFLLVQWFVVQLQWCILQIVQMLLKPYLGTQFLSSFTVFSVLGVLFLSFPLPAHPNSSSP